MVNTLQEQLRAELAELRAAGLSKVEEPLLTAQGAKITVADGAGGRREVINLCSNNYLGLADHPQVLAAARTALDTFGFGMASVRFICGTNSLHQQLERRLAEFLSMGDAILYSSCFDANTGLFETLLTEQDAIVSDELNHASIIDGVRLCKAKRYRYRNRDVADLAQQLTLAREAGARQIMVATDGVFSMDGLVAPLAAIAEVTEEHRALLMVDDSHAVGFIGETGAGTPELFGVQDQVDIVTGTFGKALGGGSGGYTAASSEIVEMLRQRSRPYLFSNSLPPPITAAALTALQLVADSQELRQQLRENTIWFRQQLAQRGFRVPQSDHPIVPVLLGDAKLAAAMADQLLTDGLYVRAFSYPVVPRGQARIRTQISAAHSRDDLQFAIEAFTRARNQGANS